MAACMTFRGRVQCMARKAVCIQPVRFRWKPPDRDAEILPSYAQRLADWRSKYESPASQGINIGFHFDNSGTAANNQDLVRKWNETRKKYEQAARHRKLTVDMDVMKDEWSHESMPQHVSTIAQHYGIFRDMYDGAHFNPVVPLEVSYDYDAEYVTPVCYGNVIPAAETSTKPSVSYEAKEDSLWTIVMTSPDGNLEDSNKELLHWFVCNIPGNAVEKGETVCDYLQPFPPKGVGFLRYVFVLYKQNQHIDAKDFQRPPNCMSLRERSFNTFEFYQKNEENLTPAGLAFFQSEWDKSVTSVFHHVLDMKEPVFEFIHPPPYFPEQKQWPHKHSFHFYLDQYRDIKDIQEEVLKHKLASVDPSKPPPARSPYPSIDLLPKTTPSWLRTKIQYMRLGKHQWKDLHDDSKE